MSAQNHNTYPKLHNAMWPGLVGKGSPGAEPCIDLDMLDLTARAGQRVKFDGVSIFSFEPHISIDIDEDGLKDLPTESIKRFRCRFGRSPGLPPTGGAPHGRWETAALS
jgi:hypothetical protein